MAGVIKPMLKTVITQPSWDAFVDIGNSLSKNDSVWFSIANAWAESGLKSSVPEGVITKIQYDRIRIFVTTMETREYSYTDNAWGNIRSATTVS